jgi:hypothetical protein
MFVLYKENIVTWQEIAVCSGVLKKFVDNLIYFIAINVYKNCSL